MTFWADRNVLVTGATGFLGGALAAALRGRGARVVGTARRARTALGEPAAIALDLTDGAAVRQVLDDHAIDSVFHLAAQSLPGVAARDPAATFDANVAATWSLLAACRGRESVRGVVLASTTKVYGDGTHDEDAPLAARDPYGVSKICAERIGASFTATFGLPVATARCGNLFGPGDRQFDRIIPGTIAALLRGEQPVIRSDGTAEHSYLYIDDAVDAFLRLGERVDQPAVAGHAFNICADTSLSVRDVVDRLIRLSGRAVEPQVLGRPGPIVRQSASPARAAAVLGWTASADLDRQLQQTIEWHRADRMAPAVAPRVLIGIPTLNRPDLVMTTIASVRAQTVAPPYRAVVSDNVSTGDIAARVAAAVAALGDANFTFVAQPANRGEYGQGRYLFDAAKAAGADYFMILHDDDVLDPAYLATAVAALDAAPTAALFVANPYLMDRDGVRSDRRTADYLAEHGRAGAAEGLFPILDAHMATGFTPISGTVFRTAALAAAGLTDDDCEGNYPFECNVMLRLGDRGAAGWFCPRELIGVRYHSESLRVYLRLMDNPAVVTTMLRLFERRRYDGAVEQRRRTIVARLHRADATIRLREGDLAGCRAAIRRACAASPLSAKAWAMRLLAWLAPRRLHDHLPTLAVRTAPSPPGTAPMIEGFAR